jgi:hypothetical protein
VRAVGVLLLLGGLGLGLSMPLAILFLCAGAASAALPFGPAGAAAQAGGGAVILVASGVASSHAIDFALATQTLAVLAGAVVVLSTSSGTSAVSGTAVASSSRRRISHMRARLTVLGTSCSSGAADRARRQEAAATAAPGPPPPATVTSGSVKATLYAPTSKPKANARWNYRVVVKDTKGRKLGGKITVQIVDPLGRAHAATYDDTTKPIKDLAFAGQFRDYVEWPADARGFTLTFRVVAKTPKGSVTVTYPVTPK